jgi:sugar/nucleoside kinase (ribokinase family)
VHVIDAVGAGDSFNAGFLHAWLSGWPTERALAFANAAGALSTTATGGTEAFCQGEALHRLSANWPTSSLPNAAVRGSVS